MDNGAAKDGPARGSNEPDKVISCGVAGIMKNVAIIVAGCGFNWCCDELRTAISAKELQPSLCLSRAAQTSQVVDVPFGQSSIICVIPMDELAKAPQ
jgi:hypothetical protein